MYLPSNQPPPEPVRGAPTLLTYAAASFFSVVPLERAGDGPIVLATAVEQTEQNQRGLRFLLCAEVLFWRVDEQRLQALLDQTWPVSERSLSNTSGPANGFKARVAVAPGSETGRDGTSGILLRSLNDVPAAQQVDELFSKAIGLGASDLHFEPGEADLRVRFRIDGVLQPAVTIDKARQAEVLSRLKILAGMDIAEKRRPQDGRIRVEGANADVDVRVSSMPTPFGEKIVLRLLDKNRQPLDLAALGMKGRNLDLFREAIAKPFGMILVTGPTGSGKTTTLYAGLRAILSPEINISTVEDPIEYLLPGINQTQMHAEIGYTFANAVRTFLRQDPDVIMIGEIRDHETAKYAIQAAQTGHLVLSTLHTNDAPSAIVRLLEMGMEPFLVASTVHLIIAQRLVRKTCPVCARVLAMDKRDLEYLGDDGADITSVSGGPGCPACANTGYRSRVGVYEMMPVSEAIQDLVVQKASSYKVRQQALQEGMQSLRHEGIALVREGVTTVAEVRAVVG